MIKEILASYAFGLAGATIIVLLVVAVMNLRKRLEGRSKRRRIKTPNGEWPSFRAFLKYHKEEGFHAGALICGACGFKAVGFFTESNPDDVPRCKRCDSKMTFHEVESGAL